MMKPKIYQSKISSKLSRVVCPISSETITKFLGIAVKNIRQWTQVWSSDFDSRFKNFLKTQKDYKNWLLVC